MEADLCLNFVPGQQIIVQVLKQRQCLYGLLGSVLCLGDFYVSASPRCSNFLSHTSLGNSGTTPGTPTHFTIKRKESRRDDRDVFA